MIIARTEDLVVAAATDVGMRRSGNEDSHVVWISEDPAELERRGVLLVVADGMGGANAGEVASKLAAETVLATFRDATVEDPAQALRGAIERANALVHEQAGRSAEHSGMGTTCTAVAVRHDRVWLGHVGDSRACLVRGDDLHRLTHDHTLVSQLVHIGQLTEEEARTDPRRNVITRSVGALAQVEVDAGEMEGRLQAGDAIVMCSDGLHGLVSDGEIAMIAGESQPDEACRDLIALANERGGPDNITVIVVRALARQDAAGAAAGTATHAAAPVDSTQILPAAVAPGAPATHAAAVPAPAPAPGAPPAPRKAPPAGLLATAMIALIVVAALVGYALWGQLRRPAAPAEPAPVASEVTTEGSASPGATEPPAGATHTTASPHAAAAAPGTHAAASGSPHTASTTPAAPVTHAAPPAHAAASPVPVADAPPPASTPAPAAAAEPHDIVVITRPFQPCTITLDGETSPDVGWVTLQKPAPTRHVVAVDNGRGGAVQVTIEPAQLDQREIVVRLPGADQTGNIEVVLNGRHSATVYVDGAQYPQSAPCTLRGLAAGPHSIRVFGVPGPVRREFAGVNVASGATGTLQVDF